MPEMLSAATVASVRRTLAQRMTPDRVAVEPKTGEDEYGAATYGPAVEYGCLVERRPAIVRTRGGEEITSRLRVHIPGAVAVGTDDRLTLLPLPSPPAEPERPPIIAVEQAGAGLSAVLLTTVHTA